MSLCRSAQSGRDVGDVLTHAVTPGGGARASHHPRATTATGQASVIKSMQASIDRARHEAEAAKQQLKVRERRRGCCAVSAVSDRLVPDLTRRHCADCPRAREEQRRSATVAGTGCASRLLAVGVSCCLIAQPYLYTVRAIAPRPVSRVCLARVCAGDWHAATA